LEEEKDKRKDKVPNGASLSSSLIVTSLGRQGYYSFYKM
jgi:hypothetical protein